MVERIQHGPAESRGRKIWRTISTYKWTLLYAVLVVIFCLTRADTSPPVCPPGACLIAPPSVPLYLKVAIEIVALLLLPSAVLSARFTRKQETEVKSTEADPSVEILIETILALATGFLLINAKDLALGKDSTFAEKVPEISLVFLLVFAVHTVWKSSTMVEHFIQQTKEQILGTVGELKDLQGELSTSASTMQSSAMQVQEARYAGLAARVLGIKNVDPFMVPGEAKRTPDTELARIAERSVDALRAWIQTGYRIQDGGGAQGRQTWWRLMESYHREEVFDVSQLEIATNVRNFAMMLLLTIEYHLNELKPGEQLVVLNVSRFPPKDFYNFPDGTAYDRFYHEPEFFGTYRRALSAITKHPRICPIRVFLCGKDNVVAPDGTNRNTEKPSNPQSNPVGMDGPQKIALDCAYLDFVPVPLTVNAADSVVADPGTQRTVDDVLKHARDMLKNRLPRGVDRVLIGPHYRWFPEYYKGPYEAAYLARVEHQEELRFDASDVDKYREEASKIVELGIAGDAANAIGGREYADFKGQLDAAWRELARRCLSFGSDEDHSPLTGEQLGVKLSEALATQKKWLETRKLPPGKTAEWENEPQRAYDAEYEDYLKYTNELYKKFCDCSNVADRLFGMVKLEREAFKKAQSEYVTQLLFLISQCQKIDSLDKYLELVTGQSGGPAPVIGSTGIRLGYAENWIHRALVYFEARSIQHDACSHGPISLWKLLASDLCGLRQTSEDVQEQFENFMEELPHRIRLYDPANDTARILNEFMLVGSYTPATIPDNGKQGDKELRPKVEDVMWKGLVGTYINEPFQTCRIQFDFCDLDYGASAARTSGRSNSYDQALGFTLREHVDWLKGMEHDKTTEIFQHHLRETWSRRMAEARRSPSRLEAPPGGD